MKFKGTISFVPEADLIRFLPNAILADSPPRKGRYTLCVPSAGCNGTLSAENTFGGNPGTHLTMPPPEYAASSALRRSSGPVSPRSSLLFQIFTPPRTSSSCPAHPPPCVRPRPASPHPSLLCRLLIGNPYWPRPGMGAQPGSPPARAASPPSPALPTVCGGAASEASASRQPNQEQIALTEFPAKRGSKNNYAIYFRPPGLKIRPER
ncbi:hypothetical protein PAPYR_11180 [Paratrimastix pyriformis]|uniref:Uncharacterized protein n=1 Tax=Paratrimastix pyriformis TaxID=342808 RepID=A0ABQ8U496_9EUKA|nr:hypothetical protein PAPYR_11180 [Paratrimastix pyriformis]